MSEQTREIYSSSNGDRWLLVRDGNDLFVRHHPNEASGGKPSRREIGAFLASQGHGPQHQELLRLIGTLVDDG
jgi:hypothetical protein